MELIGVSEPWIRARFDWTSVSYNSRIRLNGIGDVADHRFIGSFYAAILPRILFPFSSGRPDQLGPNRIQGKPEGKYAC
jgi:hypothetical protein